MNSKPLVTIYIPCGNYGRFLNQSVESVFNQLYTNWELIIIDEASDDDTAVISRELQSRFPEKITLIQNKKSIGLQKIANNVLNIANGKYLVRLDADDWFDECALLLMVAKLEATPSVGLVYGNYFYTDSDGKILGIERRWKIKNKDIGGHLPPHGACTMFRTRSLKAVGGYSVDINAQDGWELWYKLYQRVGAINLDIPLFYYRQHNFSLSRDSKRLLEARSKIFDRISSSLEGDYKPTIIAVIPVRESYPGFEGVPYKLHNGQSLLAKAILEASSSDKINATIVSSESQEVLDYAEGLEKKGDVPPHTRILRDKNDPSNKNIPLRNLMISAGESYYDKAGVHPDAVAFLSLHAINRSINHIDEALNILRVTESDTVVSVQEEREPMFIYGTAGLELLNPGRFQDLTYDRERLYSFNGSILATWWDVLKEHHLFGEKISSIEMSAEDSLQLKLMPTIDNNEV
jgi:glycosyltransferase involved in cell wall biosynthesis